MTDLGARPGGTPSDPTTARTSVVRDGAFTDPVEAARPDLRAWHGSSKGRPIVVFAVAVGSWVMALAIGLSSRHEWVRLAMAVPSTLATAQLFMIGHDAGHGSFSPSRAVNAVVGRLAFVPSVHVFGLWRHHHDLHHRFTNLRGRDFVWAPQTVAEFRALPGWRRWWHRVERHRSGLGLGLHYAAEIWMPRMLGPRAHHGLPRLSRMTGDTLLLYGLLLALAVTARQFVAVVNPDRVGDARFWASTVVFLFVVPLVSTQWLIGFVIYLNHTHPDIVWYDDPTEWSRHHVQLEGSAGQRFSRSRHWLLPRRIMNHTAHHLDPGVPLRGLDGAQQHLVDTVGHRIVSYDWSVKEFRRILAACKLYDYDAQRWLTYAAVDDQS